MITSDSLRQLNENLSDPAGPFSYVVRELDISPVEMAVSAGATRAAVSNARPADVIVVNATGQGVILTFPVPTNYNVAADRLQVSLTVALAGGTATPSVAFNVATLSRTRAGAATVAALTVPTNPPLSASVVPNVARTAAFRLSGLRLLPGDVLTIEFTGTVAGTSPVGHVFGAIIAYGSTFVPERFASRILP